MDLLHRFPGGTPGERGQAHGAGRHHGRPASRAARRHEAVRPDRPNRRHSNPLSHHGWTRDRLPTQGREAGARGPGPPISRRILASRSQRQPVVPGPDCTGTRPRTRVRRSVRAGRSLVRRGYRQDRNDLGWVLGDSRDRFARPGLLHRPQAAALQLRIRPGGGRPLLGQARHLRGKCRDGLHRHHSR